MVRKCEKCTQFAVYLRKSLGRLNLTLIGPMDFPHNCRPISSRFGSGWTVSTGAVSSFFDFLSFLERLPFECFLRCSGIRIESVSLYKCSVFIANLFPFHEKKIARMTLLTTTKCVRASASFRMSDFFSLLR